VKGLSNYLVAGFTRNVSQDRLVMFEREGVGLVHSLSCGRKFRHTRTANDMSCGSSLGRLPVLASNFEGSRYSSMPVACDSLRDVQGRMSHDLVAFDDR